MYLLTFLTQGVQKWKLLWVRLTTHETAAVSCCLINSVLSLNVSTCIWLLTVEASYCQHVGRSVCAVEAYDVILCCWCCCLLLVFKLSNDEDLPPDVKSLLLAEVMRCNSAFPVDIIFRHLSLKRNQHELSKTETGIVFVTKSVWLSEIVDKMPLIVKLIIKLLIFTPCKCKCGW